jgi:pimeloyl-ACP methyl ester carboxylesterase
MHERDVRTDDGRSVRTAASGPPDGSPILWHHGNPGSRIPWIPESMLEAAGARLITFDRPGGGRSDPLPGRRIASIGVDVAAIAEGWGLARFATAGFSGGGSFALATAALFPDRVIASAVVSGAAPIDAEGLDFTAGMTDTGTPATDHEVQTRRAELLRDMEPQRQAILADPHAALLAFVEAWPDADREALRSPEIWRPIAEGMVECVRLSAEGWFDDSAAFHRPWGFDVATIQAPVAFWHGREDTAAPITHARWLAGHIENSTLHELEGGHYAAYVELPAILDWLVSHATT